MRKNIIIEGKKIYLQDCSCLGVVIAFSVKKADRKKTVDWLEFDRIIIASAKGNKVVLVNASVPRKNHKFSSVEVDHMERLKR